MHSQISGEAAFSDRGFNQIQNVKIMEDQDHSVNLNLIGYMRD